MTPRAKVSKQFPVLQNSIPYDPPWSTFNRRNHWNRILEGDAHIPTITLLSSESFCETVVLKFITNKKFYLNNLRQILVEISAIKF
jgi:hypothetical protein